MYFIIRSSPPGVFFMGRSLVNLWWFSEGALMQKWISIKLIWNFVELTPQRGSSRGFAAFLLNIFLRDASEGMFLYH